MKFSVPTPFLRARNARHVPGQFTALLLCLFGCTSAPATEEAKDDAEPLDDTVEESEELSSCGSTITPGPSPIRRLTRWEYNNTVRDLLGDTTEPANAFPPEELGNGFGNDATALGVSRLLADQYHQVAKATAGRATADATKLKDLTACDAAKLGEETCAATFISAFGARAFRRPLEERERQSLLTVFRATRMGADYKAGIASVLTAMLQMPQFLYRLELGGEPSPDGRAVRVDHYAMASRLSYLLWGTLPDADLFEAAREGKLGSRQEVKAQALRMLEHDKAREVVRHFHDSLFGLVGLSSLTKDPAKLPAFFPGLGELLREETTRFLDDVVWNGAGDVKAMLTASHSFMNARLAKFYGVQGPTSEAFEKVMLDRERRAGFMTQGALLASSTPGTETNPVIRGVFIRNRLFCDPPPDPPSSLMVREPDPDPNLTTRQRFNAHQTEPSCKGCHAVMDPLGFGLENYDALGLWRDTDHGQPIDASGFIEGTDVEGSFNGPRELMTKLGASQDLVRCMANQWMSYGYGRGFLPEDDCTRASVFSQFAKSGFQIKALLVALTQTDAFIYRQSAETEFSP